MSLAQGKPVRPIRSLFLSDVHLGCKHSQAAALLEFLEAYSPKKLYIVGDFIDGWQLKRRWRWPQTYARLLARLVAMQRHGTNLYYTPGNHDSFLRGFLANFGIVEVRDRFVHAAADGRKFLVMHGDQFDSVERSAPWLSIVGMHVYDALLSFNRLVNRLLGRETNCFALCATVKQKVKGLVRRASKFELQLLRAAKAEFCDGVICGHIHAPRIIADDKLIYINTGDWVEHCTALVEYETGRWELMRYDGTVLDSLAASSIEREDDIWDDLFVPTALHGVAKDGHSDDDSAEMLVA